MKRHLTPNEYDEFKRLTVLILSAPSRTEAESHIKEFDSLRVSAGYIGSANNILAELYLSLTNMPIFVSNLERLSYFDFANSYLSKLRDFVRKRKTP